MDDKHKLLWRIIALFRCADSTLTSDERQAAAEIAIKQLIESGLSEERTVTVVAPLLGVATAEDELMVKKTLLSQHIKAVKKYPMSIKKSLKRVYPRMGWWLT